MEKMHQTVSSWAEQIVAAGGGRGMEARRRTTPCRTMTEMLLGCLNDVECTRVYNQYMATFFQSPHGNVKDPAAVADRGWTYWDFRKVFAWKGHRDHNIVICVCRLQTSSCCHPQWVAPFPGLVSTPSLVEIVGSLPSNMWFYDMVITWSDIIHHHFDPFSGLPMIFHELITSSVYMHFNK